MDEGTRDSEAKTSRVMTSLRPLTASLAGALVLAGNASAVDVGVVDDYGIPPANSPGFVDTLTALGMRENRLSIPWDPAAPTTIPNQQALEQYMMLSTLRGVRIVFAVAPTKATAITSDSGAAGAYVAFLQQLAFLREKGVKFHRRINHGMTHSVYISDPNGHGIEVLYELPREVWEGDIDAAFADVAGWAGQCRFNDCSHTVEPECAVRANVEPERLKSYFKLQRELTAVAGRSNARVHRELKRRWRMRTREVREAKKRGRY